MSFAEKAVLVHFIALALLWLSREPEFVPGWASLFAEGYVSDASVGVTIAFLLFVCPSERPNILCFRKKGESRQAGPVPALLDWESVEKGTLLIGCLSFYLGCDNLSFRFSLAEHPKT